MKESGYCGSQDCGKFIQISMQERGYGGMFKRRNQVGSVNHPNYKD
jgi:hypothetical protein